MIGEFEQRPHTDFIAWAYAFFADCPLTDAQHAMIRKSPVAVLMNPSIRQREKWLRYLADSAPVTPALSAGSSTRE